MGNDRILIKNTVMKNLIFLCVVLFISTTNISAQKKAFQKPAKLPFQGVKEFCSFSKPVKYKVSVTGNKVIITYLYKEYKKIIKGEFKNGKLYTNDKDEDKLIAGKYYILTSTSLSINNLEGGDYIEYPLCN